MAEKVYLTETMKGDLDNLKELAKKIDILGNDVRLKILIIIGAETKKRPERRGLTDVRELTSILRYKFAIRMTENGVKKHLNWLLKAGFIKVEAGIAERSMRGPRAVMNFILVPGALEAVNNDVNRIIRAISDVNTGIKESDLSYPLVRVLGGDDDGQVFGLFKDEVRIGREGGVDPEDEEYQGDIILSNGYERVTRISKPHATLTKGKDGEWYLEDAGSKSGVFVNNDEKASEKIKLVDGDLIKLALGEGGAEMVFVSSS
ncbi:FHA domain-containing protein [uncultured Methanobacterium sp.]|uniref:FHA domain-containing protein n=1 Tax=uncultured Methanobacterium sp. TaxID=176306 RepID=UPI002AA814E3|nr:FHA domain-containing protein [uncultured Methanobacterium sp.]